MKKLFAIAIILLSFHLMVSCSELFVSNCDNDINKNNAYHDQENNDLGGEANEIIDDPTNKVLDKKDEDEIGSLIGATTPEDGDHNDKNDQISINGNSSVGESPDGDVGESPDGEKQNAEYLVNSNGRPIYGSINVMSVPSAGGKQVLFANPKEISFVQGHVASPRVFCDELVGYREVSLGGELVRVGYSCSYISKNEDSKLSSQYGSIDVYEDELGAMYIFSRQTGEIIRYDYMDGSYATGDLSEDAAIKVATAFLKEHVGGIDLNQYEMQGPALRESIYLGRVRRYYSFTFVRKLCGFETCETANILVSMDGKVCAYVNDFSHLYDEFYNTVNEEGVKFSLWDMCGSLISVGIGIDENSARILVDDDGKLYINATSLRGYSFYSEIIPVSLDPK